MKTISKIVLILSIVLVIGCGESTKETSSKKENNIPWVVVSQDTYDRDNFSMVYLAKKLHDIGMIRLVAVVVTGVDTNNKAGQLFEVYLHGSSIPVLINQRYQGRAYDASSIFDLNQYSQDGLYDIERPDSVQWLVQYMQNMPKDKKLIYATGGHLNTIADLIREYPQIVAQHIQEIDMSVGWDSRYNSKAETNFSEGLYKSTTTSKATITVFTQAPKEVKLVITSDPDMNWYALPLSWIKDPLLHYMTENGHYTKHDGMFYPGDFEALLYAVTGTNWYGQVWAKEVQTCFKPKGDYGVITISNGACNHYYLDDVNTGIVFGVMHDLLQ